MVSSQDIPNQAYLELCVEKKRSFQNIYENLELYAGSGSGRVRIEPDFPDGSANELQKKIIATAKSFREANTEDDEDLKKTLLEDDMFSDEVIKLGDEYGQMIWGSPTIPESRQWGIPEAEKAIRFYLRCWITRHVVRMSRRGRGRVGGRAPILSDGDHSDLESARSPPRRPFLQAPPAPRMIPEKRFTRPSTAAVNIVSQSQKLSTIQRLPRTSNKRRFDMGAPQSAPGKLQKVRKNNLDSSNIRQNTYPIPNSPEPTSYPSRPVTNGLQAREGTWDTDQTYALQRADTIESETVINPEEVIAARAELDDEPFDGLGAEDRSFQRTPTARPTGTYRDPSRQDSVIPCDAQPGPSQQRISSFDGAGSLHMRALTDLENIVNSSLGTNDVDSVHRLGQERQLRNELTILLLSYINNINDFAQDNFQWEAEERMNNLILHLWKTDTIRLEAKFGDTFARMNTSLKTWMDMRQRLERLRVGIGYLGAPGDDWKNHLNRMVYATRANAVIALTNMRKLQSVADAAWDQETFDNDLAVIFDELTQIIGCNGAEEFGALRLYNQTLFDWFR